jgi:hypothetical protein
MIEKTFFTTYKGVLTEWVIEDGQKKRVRWCADCKKMLAYNSKRGYFSCKKKNSKCESCSALDKMNRGESTLPYKGGCTLTNEHKKKLSESGKLRHQKYKHPMLGKKQSEKCIRLAKKKFSGSGNPMFGKHHTKETCQKISESRLSKKIPGPKMSENGLRILRQKRIKEISIDKFNGNQVVPSFNKISCLFFDKIETELNWDGYYATKGGEYQIKELGYFVDYYEPKKNLVIEWDEPRHYVGGILKKDDVDRQSQIEKFLGCKFVRINQKTVNETELIKEFKKYD